MAPNQLLELGETLGAGWQSQLSRLLPCNVRTIQYWLTGKRAIRPMVEKTIRAVIKKELEGRYGK